MMRLIAGVTVGVGVFVCLTEVALKSSIRVDKCNPFEAESAMNC
jgi:hypothetical protein